MALSHAVKPASFWKEAQALAASLAPGWNYDRSELSTVYHKTRAYFQGEVVDFGGRKHPPLYTPRNATLIERFGITDDEQRNLRTILSQTEARRRDAERKRQARQKAGAQDRQTYEATAQQRREMARSLRAEGMTQREIAARLGVSDSAVRHYLK